MSGRIRRALRRRRIAESARQVDAALVLALEEHALDAFDAAFVDVCRRRVFGSCRPLTTPQRARAVDLRRRLQDER